MRNRVLALILGALTLGAHLAVPLTVLAQGRDPAGRQTLVDMAYVLGEAHALRQACGGASDQYWRNRMVRLVETEQADATLTQRLKDAFNTGFVARQGAYPACTQGARTALSKVLSRGKVLAARLAQEGPGQSDTAQTDDKAARPR